MKHQPEKNNKEVQKEKLRIMVGKSEPDRSFDRSSSRNLSHASKQVKAEETPEAIKHDMTTTPAHSEVIRNWCRSSSTSGMPARKQLKVSGIALIAGALVCFLMQLASLQKSINSKDWPVADAKVTTSRILYRHNPDGTPKLNSEGSLDLRYQYSVKGIGYSADRYKLFGMIPNNASLERIVESHPVNATIKIRYNPQNNAEACVESGSASADPWSTIFYSSGALLVLGLILTLVGTVLGKASNNAGRPFSSEPALDKRPSRTHDRRQAILKPVGIVLIMVIAAIACRFLLPSQE